MGNRERPALGKKRVRKRRKLDQRDTGGKTES